MDPTTVITDPVEAYLIGFGLVVFSWVLGLVFSAIKALLR